jgi:hypothetical protein
MQQVCFSPKFLDRVFIESDVPAQKTLRVYSGKAQHSTGFKFPRLARSIALDYERPALGCQAIPAGSSKVICMTSEQQD